VINWHDTPSGTVATSTGCRTSIPSRGMPNGERARSVPAGGTRPALRASFNRTARLVPSRSWPTSSRQRRGFPLFDETHSWLAPAGVNAGRLEHCPGLRPHRHKFLKRPVQRRGERQKEEMFAGSKAERFAETRSRHPMTSRRPLGKITKGIAWRGSVPVRESPRNRANAPALCSRSAKRPRRTAAPPNGRVKKSPQVAG